MCLCKGTGSIANRDPAHPGIVEFIPCPDSNCQFDRVAADKKYEEWRVKLDEYCRTSDAIAATG